MSIYKFKNWSITTKVFVYACLVVVVSVVSVASWGVYRYYQLSWQEIDKRARIELSGAAENLQLPVMIGQHDEVERILGELLSTPDVYKVKVVDENDTEVASLSKQNQPKEITSYQAKLYAESARYEGLWGDNAESQADLGKLTPIGHVELIYSLDARNRKAQRLIFDTLLISLLVVGFSCVVGYLFATEITKPLRQLSLAARRVGDGDYSARLHMQADDEVGQLASVFDGMVSSLQHKTNELVRSNRKLKQSNEDLDRFAYVVSHDLGAPLRRISDFCRILNRIMEGKTEEKEAKLLERVRLAAESGIEMIDGLLEFSRVKTRAKPFEKIDLKSVVQTIRDEYEIQLGEVGGEINFSELPEIDADPIQIKQLFSNIIGNAIKYRRDGVPPIVNVECIIDSDYVTLSIIDNGIGFEQNQVEQIFQVFKRLHRDESKYQGNGVGLAICDRIVRRMKGSITAKSSPGEGAEFIIKIPLRQPLGEEGDE